MKTSIRREDGFSLIELMIVLLVAGVLMAIAIPMMREALLRAHIGAATAEARTVHSAFKRYHVDQSFYPDPGGLSTTTLAPLTTLGYYDGDLAASTAVSMSAQSACARTNELSSRSMASVTIRST